MSATVTSFKEIPLGQLNEEDHFRRQAQDERNQESFDVEDGQEKNSLKKDNATYGSLNPPEVCLKWSVLWWEDIEIYFINEYLEVKCSVELVVLSSELKYLLIRFIQTQQMCFFLRIVI